MADFDISILSTLDIDASSSKNQINDKIKSISDKINKIYAEVEVKDTKANADSLRKSANKIIGNVKDTGSLKKLNVELDVNLSKSRTNINNALSKLSKEFTNKKIDVAVNAKVDSKSVNEAQKQVAKGVSKANVPDATSTVKADSFKKEESNAKQYSEAILNIAKQYKNVDAIQATLAKNTDANIRTQIKAVKDATGAVKTYQVSLEKLDEAGKASRKRVLDYQLNDGVLNLKKDTYTDASDKANKKTQEEIAAAIKKQEQYYTDLANKQKISEEHLKSILAMYEKINVASAKGMASPSDFEKVKNSAAAVSQEMEKQKAAQDAHLARQKQIVEEIDKEDAKFQKLINSGKINEEQLKRIRNSFAAIRAEAEKNKANPDHYESIKKHTKEVANNIELQNRYYKKQHDIITLIDSAERRKADSIDKRALNALRKETLNLGGANGMPFAKDAAYQMNQIHQQVKQISAEADRATRSQLGFVDSFRQAMVKFPVWMGATTIFFGAIRSAKEFMSTIVEIDSKMVTLAKVMGDGTDLAAVFDKANEAALNYGQTISGVLDVYAEFARQGYKGDELTQFGNAGLIAANVGEISPQQASEYLTSMSAQWETDANQAMRQVDALNEISNNYATTVEKLAQGQAKAGSTAKQMGMTFDETNAVIGALTAKTKQSGDEIGNFMKAVLPSLYNGKGKDTIEGLGINFKDQQGEIKGAMQLLEEVSQKIKSMDKAQQAAVINGIGGKYHYQRLQVLLDDLSAVDSKYKQIKDTSENSAGSALNENAIYMESAEAKINRAKVSIEQFAIALGDVFLKSGMLDGIRLFTDAMTALTKSITEMGTAAPIFGALVGAVSLFSKNVRSGFKGARDSVADFIAESNRLKDAQSNIQNASNISTSVAKPSVDTSGETSKNAASASAASASTKQLSSANKELAVSANTATGAVGRASAANTANAATSRIATAATKGFGLALRSLLSATGVGIAVMGVSFVLEKIVGHFDQARQASEKFEQQQEQTKQALQSMPSEELDGMINKYETLRQKMSSGHAFDSTEAKEYKDVVSQLSNIFPDLVSGEGKYGTSLNANKAVLKERVEVMRQQLQLQKEIENQKKIEENNELIKAKDKEASGKKIGPIKYDAPKNALDDASQNVLGQSQEINQLNKKIAAIKGVTDANKVLKQINDQMKTAIAAGDQKEIEALKEKEKGVNNYIMKINQQKAAQQAAQQAATQNFMMEVAKMKQGNYSIQASGTAAMQTLANSVAKVSKSGAEAQNTFEKLKHSLVLNPDFVSEMQSYESALKKFQEAGNSAESASAVKELEKAYSSMAQSIVQSAQQAGLSKEAIKELLVGLQQQAQAETGLSVKIDKTGKATFEATKKTEDNTDATKDNTKAKQDNADSAESQAEANKELANSLQETAKKHELLNKAQEEMAETGTISTQTMIDLVALYGDEVLGAMNDYETLSNFIMEKRDEETNHLNDSLKTKLENSETYYQAVAQAGGELSDYLKETYGIDAENYTSLASVKGKITNMYNKGTAEEQEKVVQAIADAYGIDLSNYGSLGEKKEALEIELMKILGDKWNQYVSGIAADMEVLGVHTEGAKVPDGAQVVPGPPGTGYLQVRGTTVNTNREFDAGALIGDNDAIFKKFTGSTKDFGSALDNLDSKLKDAGNGADKVGKSAGDAAKGLKKSADAAKKAKEEAEQAGISVEVLYKTFTITTYVADKLSMALDKVNFQLEKQRLNTQKYATWSQKYRDSLKEENKLLDEKTKKLNEQIKSFEEQIRTGQVIEYGLVNRQEDAAYYKYSANNLEAGQSAAVSGLVGNSNAQKIWNFLKSQGFSDVQAAGIMGNFEAESGLNPAAEQMSGWVGGKGLAQWDDRKNNLKKFADSKGKSWKDLYTQLQFMMHELQTSESRAYSAIKSATSVNGAANTFLSTYERAGVPNESRRINSANKYYNQFKGTSASSNGGSVVSGMSGKYILSDGSAYILDKQFGRYNNGGVHHGRDLTGPNVNNAQIRAARAGVVTFSGWTGGGNTISIFDGTNTYTYMHMIRPSNLKKGQTVAAGQVVGNVGSTFDRSLGGFSTGPHLHIQVNKGQTSSGTFVNRFDGPNAAIDPESNGYLRVSGGGNISAGEIASGNYNADQVNDLNAAEEARMAQLEAAINERNAEEAMKQKVDQLKKTLMDTQLERLRVGVEKNENLFKIAKSQTEKYDHLKEIQEAKSAKLTYELNKIEFEKGRNNEDWRKKNKELQDSRAEEQKHLESKKEYIGKVLKENPDKIFDEDTVFRDEFEKMSREADNAIREIKSGIQHSNGEIAASLIDQILEEFEDKRDEIQRSIDKIGKEKEKLDVEDNAQAEKSVALSKQQSENADNLAKHIQFYISQLKIQQKEIKNNHELNKRVKEQIKEMEAAYDDAALAAHQFLVEAASIDIERQLRVNTERLFKAQAQNRKAEYDGSFINQEYQIDLYRKNQEEKVKGIFEERKALEENKKELEEQLKTYEKLPTQAKQLRDAIEEVSTALKENNKNLYTLRFDLSNSMVNQIKAIYQKQLEIATKAYDDEYKEFEKMINKKLKLIDEEANEEQFNKDVADKTEALNKIRDEIAQRTGDDSLANLKKLKDLQEQLTKGEEEYDTFLKNKNREDRRKALQEELQDKNEQVNKQKEDMNKAFQDLIGDTRKFNEIQESLMEGQIEKYKELVQDLTRYVNEQMQEIGRSTSESLLDGLAQTFGSLSKLSASLKEDENKNKLIPNSTLKPTTVSEETLEAIKKVNAISPTTILKDFNIKTLTPPKDVNNKTTTNNNNTQIDNLVKIDNFNGTKQETDKLATDIANALRKQGQL